MINNSNTLNNNILFKFTPINLNNYYYNFNSIFLDNNSNSQYFSQFQKNIFPNFDFLKLNLNNINQQQTNQFINYSIPNQYKNEDLNNSYDKKIIKSPKKLSYNFHLNFNMLKKKLNIENTRKTHVDSILKKTKSKFLKAIHEILKVCINKLISRLPQNFITNIKIDYNKFYLKKTIGEIYKEFNILPSFKEIKDNNLIRKDKLYLLEQVYNSTFENIYIVYLESEIYKKDYKKILEKDGEKMAILYDYVSKNMCNYYLLSKGNKKKIHFNHYNKSSNIFYVNNNLSN